jgi:hypothetical protein
MPMGALMPSKRQERRDRELVREIAEAIAQASGATHVIRCETDDCYWAAHRRTAEEAQADYDDHLRNSARHNDGLWTDRYGRQRRGLGPA